MKKMNPTLAILMLIMLINSLSYGIIIPLLYPYSSRFGIGPQGLGFLFASFSLAQFIATPILGRLSDRFGRKPILAICLLGSTLSLALFAAANSVAILVIARLIDGITGGNVSVAQAVVADTTTEKDRAKAFGMIGAAFGFGFIFGPALGGLMSNIDISAPFWFASGLALIATLVTTFFLKESLPQSDRQDVHKPLFAFQSLVTSLFKPQTGIVFVISLLSAIAFNGWIIGFQTFTVDTLKLSTFNISLLFALFGVVNVIMQAVGIKYVVKAMKTKERTLAASVFMVSLTMFAFAFTAHFFPFSIACIVLAVFAAPQAAMISTLLSQRTKAEDQGGVLGLNQAYNSLGQIAGPLISGQVTMFGIRYVFVAMGLLSLLSSLASKWLFVPVKEKLDL